MGEQNVSTVDDNAKLRQFVREILQDVRALEHMLAHDMFETGIRRIGAEQELFLIDERGQPAPIVEQVLEHNTDDRVVTELTKFNLEFNMDPMVFGGDCLRRMEEDVTETLEYVREIVQKAGGDTILTGILPTIHISDLVLDNMTPKPRYYALNDALSRLRGGPAQFQIRGVDELFVKHDSIMLEGCNTSFQTHFQVEPDEFADLYNIAQVAAGPCLACSTNSPTLFGKRLWQETRIALFQQAVDTRSTNLYLRDMSPRVHFGTHWVRDSVTEIFKEDISRFRVILSTDEPEDPFERMDAGAAPKLKALQLHNGTVYRWNRACYGITDGKPHLRIENRILPSGPTPIDEVANSAFWFGLVSGLYRKYGDITDAMLFDDAKSNFIAAARLGLSAQLMWLNGRKMPASELICDELLPLAREGLAGSGIDEEDIDRYLGVIRDRVQAQRTGADWQIESLAKMREAHPDSTRADRLNSLVLEMRDRQAEGAPVHTWDCAQLRERTGPREMEQTRVEHFMSTDLFTVHQDELVEFVACLMDWQRIRHVLVEDHQHRLVGLVTHRSVLRFLAEHGPGRDDKGGIPVRQIMVKDPISVTPETHSREAIKLMRDEQIGALPVVRDAQLVGLITERDFLSIAGKILDRSLNLDKDELGLSELALRRIDS
jgi:CBS domain-containing protein/gamma-glutamyl:cysteine ligase YbdK (ATP-grasp superfamily)